MRSTKRIAAFISAAAVAVTCITPEYIFTANAEDYSIELEIGVTEFPINYIEDDRYVFVRVYVHNNPGIESLSFVLEKDERLGDDIYGMMHEDYPFGHHLQIITDDDDNYVGYFSGFNDSYYYDTDGLLCSLGFQIPTDCKVGDFYDISFYPEEPCSQRLIEFYKDGERYDGGCFSYINGGILITEAMQPGGYIPPSEPENNETTPPPPPPVQTQPVQSQHNNNSNTNNNNNNNNNTADNSGSSSGNDSDSNSSDSNTNSDEKKTTTASTSTTKAVSTSSSKTTTSVSKTTSAASGTQTDTTSCETDTAAETTCTTTVSNPSSEKNKKSENKSGKKVLVISAIIIAAGAAAAFIIKKKSK